MDTAATQQYVTQTWDQSIISTLQEYIKIPCKSPAFDAQWQEHGYIDQALTLATQWCEQHAAKKMQLEIVRLPKRTPLLYIEIPGQIDETVLLYGHLDKQPEMTGWDDDKGPWQPVLMNDRLYGRGGADDGYAVFASLTAINALQQQQLPHARCVILIECCEESSSDDLPYYVEHLRSRIGKPSLVICLDSGCGNYDQLWCTNSLRGVITGDLRVDVLTEGVHSGGASGIVPSSFRVMRELLDRLEDPKTGKCLIKELSVSIPEERLHQAKAMAKVLGDKIINAFPFIKKMRPVTHDHTDLILNRSWRPTLCIIGIEGLPSLADAGNVLRPYTALKFSIRTPPSCDVDKACKAIVKALTTNLPYDAHVSVNIESNAGWHAPDMQAWLADSVERASQHFFNKSVMYMGEGGSIPFMGMLGEMFPQAQFLITGVLGPNSNAHGPNEFLHIPTVKKVTCCVAEVLHDHYQHFVDH